LQYVLEALGAAIVLVLLRRAAAKLPRTDSEGRAVLAYPIGLQLFSWGFVLTVCDVAVATSYSGSSDAGWARIIVPPVLVAMGGALGLETTFIRVAVSQECIECYSPWRRHRRVLWDDVVAYRYSELNDWHVLETRRHGRIRVHSMMRGADAIKAHARVHDVPGAG
jgi:hypothetical protein